ncbi:hypothetical protein G7Y79_00042g078370 [Physcia stellaris]|nr:hypothetical protein G7Y79_00042g078370 [Physcia stellaris]
MASKQRKREARKRAEAAKPAPPAYFGLFNPTATDDDPEWDIFSESTGILQRLQQLQLLHRESDLLDLLQGCLMGPALDWFKGQPEFTSLHDFDIALTNAFPPKQVNSSSLSISAPEPICETSESSADSALANRTDPSTSFAPREQQEFEGSTSDRCQWCQLDYETWDSHRLQYPFCAAQNQQAYEFALQFLEEQEQQKPNAIKIAKRTKTNAVKNAKRAKSKALKAEEAAKSTPTLQDIGIFDPTLTCEDRRFSESEEFLQHLQQCQHQYRESDLLTLLPACLWGSAFDIWFDRQTTMKSTSLTEWIDTLRVDFANAPFAKPKVNCLNITCMRCDSSFNSKEKLREHVRGQHVKKPVNCSSLSIDTAKSICEIEESPAAIKAPALQAPHILPTAPRIQIAPEVTPPKSSSLPTETPKVVCETMKKSTAIDSPAPPASQEPDTSTATPKQKSESAKTSEAVTSSKGSHLQSDAPKTVPELMENTSTHCSPIPSKSPPFQTFESSPQEASVQKLSESCSLLSINTAKSVCEIQESSAFITFKRSCPTCRIEVPSVKDHYLESPSCHEALRHRLERQLARRAHQREQEAQEQAELAEQESRKRDSHLSINAINLICEIEEKPSVTHVEPLTSATPSMETPLQSVSARCSSLQLRALDSAPKSMESASDQEATCAQVTCKLCKQSFNSNRELYEHIRNHETQQPVKDSHLSINAVNLVCEIKETSPAPHKLPAPPAKPQRPISESAVASRTITLLKPSDLSSPTPETRLGSTERPATCRRCNRIFNSNNKLHDHIRKHHARKPVKSLNPQAPTPELTYKTIGNPASICPPAPLAPQKSPTPPATPRSQKSWFSQTASTRSDLPIATYKIIPKPAESVAAVSPLPPPSTPPHSPVRKHQEPHIQKSYLTANDLSRMFAGKSRPFGLRQHHNRHPSQQGSGIRQSCSVKPDLTIENLFEMFDEKSRRKGLFQGQNNVSSQAPSGQMRITAYFKPRANQEPSISQDSKAQNRRVWTSTCLRNQSALPSAEACLRNWPIYHTNCQMSPAI